MNKKDYLRFNKYVCLFTALLVAISAAMTFLPYPDNYFAKAQNTIEENETELADDESDTNDADNAEVEDEEETDPAITQSLSERIQKVVEEKEDTNGLVAGQANYTTRAIIGKVERLSEANMTVASIKGPVIVPITEEVELIKDNQLIEISDIEIENSAVVLGIQAGESFTPIKVIIDEDEVMPRSQIVEIGTIKEVGTSSLSIITRLDSSTKTFTVNQSTTVIDADNEVIRSSDLFEDVQVIVVGYTDQDSEAEEKPRVAQLIKALAALERTE